MPKFDVTLCMTFQATVEAANADHAKQIAEAAESKIWYGGSIYQCQDSEIEVGDQYE
jgi:hypothetical protein